jgi:hygromycin-B 7''-O-kinase
VAEAFPTGTNLVVGLGPNLILKVFPPFLKHQYVSERLTLPLLKGRVSVAVPELVADGARDGWPYLVISRLPGRLGKEVWPHLPEDQKERVLRQIGKTIAEVQSAPLGELTLQTPQWRDFLKTQIANCRARQIRLGLPERLLPELDLLLADAETLIPADQAPVILTGEYIPENFLLSDKNGASELVGIIDFGDVMTGYREYDLLGPSTFMAAGHPGRVRSLLSGFGYSDKEMSPELGRRLLALMFLHRFSDPLKQICIPGWERRVRSLAELEQLLWPFD